MRTTITRLALASVATLAGGSALASEDYDLRYAPGVGGADMSAPFEGGWVFQAPFYTYSGAITSRSSTTTDLTPPPFGVPIPGAAATTDIDVRTQINVVGLLPRLSYMSQEKFLGAQLGATALLPIIKKKSSVSVQGVSTSLNDPAELLPAANQSAIIGALNAGFGAGANALAAGNSSKDFALGDFEVSPILRWSSENQQLLFIATVVMPTGNYQAERSSNASAGKFWTFRPAVQYSYIGDGWDFGTRVAFSINTRNTETHYRTGNYVNVDSSLMKSVDDSLRLGMVGYAVAQTTRDSLDGEPEDPVLAARLDATAGQGGHVFGLGPQIAYIKGAGEYLVEARFIREFGAENRPRGYAVFATLSKPF